jgi:hypothetical protein
LSICSFKDKNKEVFNREYKKYITKNKPVAIRYSSSQLKKPLPKNTKTKIKIKLKYILIFIKVGRIYSI